MPAFIDFPAAWPLYSAVAKHTREHCRKEHRAHGPPGPLRRPPSAQPSRLAGRRRRADCPPAQGRQEDGARAAGAPARQGLVCGDGSARRPHGPGLRHGRAASAGRRRRHRVRPHSRPAGVRLRPGLHGVRRLALRGVCAEDLQDHGPRHEDGRAHHRAQRFGGRAHPGGRRLPCRLRRHLPAQYPGLRRRPADLRDHGALRRRCGLLTRHHRLRVHGQAQLLHVRDGAGRDQGGDARGGLPRGAGGRVHACRHLRGGALRGGERGGVPGPHPRAVDLPPPEQLRRPARARVARSSGSGRRGAAVGGARAAEQALRHQGHHRGGARRPVSLRGPGGVRARIS